MPVSSSVEVWIAMEEKVLPGGTQGAPGEPQSVSGVLSCPDPLSNPRVSLMALYSVVK